MSRNKAADDLPKETRFHRILNPEIARDVRVMIVGCGAVGGWLGDMLCRLGIVQFELWDADRVGKVNLGVQPYFLDDIGVYKVDALAKRMQGIVEEGGTDRDKLRIRKQVRRFTATSAISPLNDFVVVAVDNHLAREMVYRKLRFDTPNDKPRIYIDPRMGARTWEMWATGWGGDPRVFNRKHYESGMNALRGLPPAPCGEQSTPYNGPMLAAAIAAQITNILTGGSIVHWMAGDLNEFGLQVMQRSVTVKELLAQRAVEDVPQPTLQPQAP